MVFWAIVLAFLVWVPKIVWDQNMIVENATFRNLKLLSIADD